MRLLIVLVVVLAAALAEFLIVGRPLLAAERSAHADLLAREASVRAMEARLPPSLTAELSALQADRDRMAALGRHRLQLLSGTDDRAPRPTFEALLEARKDRALALDTPLGASVRAQAKGSARAEEALAVLLEAVGDCRGLEVLELSDEGRVSPVPGVPGLEQVQGSLVVSSGIGDVLTVLERLAPDPAGGLPFATVLSASLRRIEPERWGSGLHAFDMPPARLAVTVTIHFARSAEAGS